MLIACCKIFDGINIQKCICGSDNDMSQEYSPQYTFVC